MLHSKQAEIPFHHVAPREALEVARYVTDMTGQLEAMAVAAHLDLLAYFLSMAKAEGDLFVRGNAQADGSRVESGEMGPVDLETDSVGRALRMLVAGVLPTIQS